MILFSWRLPNGASRNRNNICQIGGYINTYHLKSDAVVLNRFYFGDGRSTTIADAEWRTTILVGMIIIFSRLRNRTIILIMIV